MAEYTDFGLNVKSLLDKPPRKTQQWLIDEVKKDTGLYVDKPYMSKILTGQRKAPKIVASISKILDIT